MKAGNVAGHGMHSFNFITLSAFIKTHLSQGGRGTKQELEILKKSAKGKMESQTEDRSER